MADKIGEIVSVNLVFNSHNGTAVPRHIEWHNRVYKFEKLGLHYTKYEGETLLHLFAVNSVDTYFLLSFNSKTLVWRLEEVGDKE